MTAESVQGFDAEVVEKLQEKFGPGWEEHAQYRWGSDWMASCHSEMDAQSGLGWRELSPEEQAEAIVLLLQPPEELADPNAYPATDQAAAPDVRQDDAEDFAPGDGPSLDDLAWSATVAEAASFEDWLVRIGIDGALVATFMATVRETSKEAGQ